MLYVREGEAIREGFGEPFPTLKPCCWNRPMSLGSAFGSAALATLIWLKMIEPWSPASRRPVSTRASRRSKSGSAILAAHARHRGARTLGVHDDAAPFDTSRRSRSSSFCHP